MKSTKYTNINFLICLCIINTHLALFLSGKPILANLGNATTSNTTNNQFNSSSPQFNDILINRKEINRLLHLFSVINKNTPIVSKLNSTRVEKPSLLESIKQIFLPLFSFIRPRQNNITNEYNYKSNVTKELNKINANIQDKPNINFNYQVKRYNYLKNDKKAHRVINYDIYEMPTNNSDFFQEDMFGDSSSLMLDDTYNETQIIAHINKITSFNLSLDS